MKSHKLLPLVLLLVVFIGWMIRVQIGSSGDTLDVVHSDFPGGQSQSGITEPLLNAADGAEIRRANIPAATSEDEVGYIALSSTVGARIEKIIIREAGGERRFLILPQTGRISRALVPEGAVLVVPGHSPQGVTKATTEISFSPYASLRIYGCPMEVEVLRLACHFVHEGEVGSFYVWAEKIGNELLVMAMPPMELESVDQIGVLPLRLWTSGGLSLDVEFFKKEGSHGECSWSDILAAQAPGPLMRVSVVGNQFHNVQWHRFIRLPPSRQASSEVCRGPWGAMRISAPDTNEIVGTGEVCVFNDIPLGAEVLFLAFAEDGLVGWSQVLENRGQQVEVELQPRMKVSLGLRDSDLAVDISGKPYAIKMRFTSDSPESRKGKQKATQEFRGKIAKNGILHLEPRLNPLALFSWLRPDALVPGLPTELNIQISVQGYSMIELTEPIKELGSVDLGTVELEPGGNSIELQFDHEVDHKFVAGSHGLGVDLESGQSFQIKSYPGFQIESTEPLPSNSFRLWLSGKGAASAKSSFLLLDTEHSSTSFVRSSSSNMFEPIGELDFQVEIGPETRAKYSGSRLAMAFGNSALISFPFSERLEAGTSCVLEFRAPDRGQFLVFLPITQGGMAHCYSVNPGWNYLP